MDANQAMEGYSERSHTVSESRTYTQSFMQQSSPNGETYHNTESSGHPATTEEVHQTTEAPINPISTSSSTSSWAENSQDGRWGEQEAGKPVSRSGAMEDIEDMRRELTRISLHRTRSTTKSVRRLKSRVSHRDEEKAKDEGSEAEAEGFDLGEFLIGGHLERRTTAGEPAKKVGVVFKNLTVQGVETGASFVRTLPHAVVGTFGPDLYNLVCRFAPQLRFGKKQPVRDLIHDFSGAVREVR